MKHNRTLVDRGYDFYKDTSGVLFIQKALLLAKPDEHKPRLKHHQAQLQSRQRHYR